MAETFRTIVTFDREVLFSTDTYLAELRRGGVVTDRSQLVNTALLFYLQHVREKEAGKEPVHA